MFYDPSFPYAGTRPDETAIKELSERFAATDAQSVSEAIHGADVFVHLHGPYFPK